MELTATLRLTLIQKDIQKKITTLVESEDDYLITLNKRYQDRFDKATTDKSKKLIIQGFMQNPIGHKIVGEKMNDEDYRYYIKTAECTDFYIGSKTKENSKKVEESIPVKKKKGRGRPRKVVL